MKSNNKIIKLSSINLGISGDISQMRFANFQIYFLCPIRSSLRYEFNSRLERVFLLLQKKGHICLFLKSYQKRFDRCQTKEPSFGAKIYSQICPWTLSVPRSSKVSSSFALAILLASDNRRYPSILSGQTETVVDILLNLMIYL